MLLKSINLLFYSWTSYPIFWRKWNPSPGPGKICPKFALDQFLEFSSRLWKHIVSYLWYYIRNIPDEMKLRGDLEKIPLGLISNLPSIWEIWNRSKGYFWDTPRGMAKIQWGEAKLNFWHSKWGIVQNCMSCHFRE